MTCQRNIERLARNAQASMQGDGKVYSNLMHTCTTLCFDSIRIATTPKGAKRVVVGKYGKEAQFIVDKGATWFDETQVSSEGYLTLPTCIATRLMERLDVR